MKSFSTTITINANAEQVWSLLTDSSQYPTWNESVEKLEGTIAPNEKIKVYAKITPGQAFPVKVVEFVPNQKMVWQGGMPLGLFKGVRTFTLVSQQDGQVEFSMHEVFSGLVAPLITQSIPDLTPAFELFAACLKKTAEQATMS
ncbi:MAG: SRPBCC domain-containing protein [Cyanobacteria bacterium P01_H01_bin.121]